MVSFSSVPTPYRDQQTLISSLTNPPLIGPPHWERHSVDSWASGEVATVFSMLGLVFLAFQCCKSADVIAVKVLGDDGSGQDP